MSFISYWFKYAKINLNQQKKRHKNKHHPLRNGGKKMLHFLMLQSFASAGQGHSGEADTDIHTNIWTRRLLDLCLTSDLTFSKGINTLLYDNKRRLFNQFNKKYTFETAGRCKSVVQRRQHIDRSLLLGHFTREIFFLTSDWSHETVNIGRPD